jgi:hypothetical protein
MVEVVQTHPGSTQKDLIDHGRRNGVAKDRVLAALQEAVAGDRIEARSFKAGRNTCIRYYPMETRFLAV